MSYFLTLQACTSLGHQYPTTSSAWHKTKITLHTISYYRAPDTEHAFVMTSVQLFRPFVWVRNCIKKESRPVKNKLHTSYNLKMVNPLFSREQTSINVHSSYRRTRDGSSMSIKSFYIRKNFCLCIFRTICKSLQIHHFKSIAFW